MMLLFEVLYILTLLTVPFSFFATSSMYSICDQSRSHKCLVTWQAKSDSSSTTISTSSTVPLVTIHHSFCSPSPVLKPPS